MVALVSRMRVLRKSWMTRWLRSLLSIIAMGISCQLTRASYGSSVAAQMKIKAGETSNDGDYRQTRFGSGKLTPKGVQNRWRASDDHLPTLLAASERYGRTGTMMTTSPRSPVAARPFDPLEIWAE
jgi:hypothetical protein